MKRPSSIAVKLCIVEKIGALRNETKLMFFMFSN